MRATRGCMLALGGLVLLALAAISCVDAVGTACDTQNKLATEVGTVWAAGVAVASLTVGGATTSAVKITSTASDQASAAYISKQVRVMNGFRATFSFQTAATPTLGFAFVVQAQSTQVVGGSSANLGYNFAKSLAIEFDMYQDSTIADFANSNHIEVHTLYSTGNNSPGSTATVGGANTNAPGVNMNDGNLHTVKINYIPASATTSIGSMTIQVDSAQTITVPVNTDSITAMFPNGMAYLGFTASTSNSIKGEVTIRDFTLQTIQVDPAQTMLLGGVPGPAVATDVYPAAPNTRIQLVDACGSSLPVSYGTTAVTATLTGGPAGSSTIKVVDALNGIYNIFWYTTKAAIPSTALSLNVQYRGTTIGNAQPIGVSVVPGVPLGSASTLAAPIGTTFVAGVTQNFIVEVRDRLGNPTVLTTGFMVLAGFPSDDPDLTTFTTQSTVQTANGPVNQVPITLMSTTAQAQASAVVRVRNPNVAPDTDVIGTPKQVSVTAGVARGISSDLSSSTGGLSSVVANTQGSVTLAVNDIYRNPVVGNPPGGAAGTVVSGQLVWGSGQGTGPAPITMTVAYASGNLWTLTYTTTKAGSYALIVKVGPSATQEQLSGSYNVYIAPGPVQKADSIAALPSATSGIATTFTLQAYDNFGNTRTAANDAGSDLTITITAAGVGATVTCAASPAAFTPTAQVSNFMCKPSATIGGRYDVTVTPLVSGAYTVDAAITAKTAFTLTYRTFTTVAGAPSATRSSVSGLSGSVSGVPETFSVTIRDAQGNVRTGATIDDRSYISFAQFSSGGTTLVPTARAPTGNGIIVFEYTPIVASTVPYTLQVKLSGTDVPFAASEPTSTLVVPGPLSPLKSTVSGAGISGGVGDTTVTFTIQAKDAQGNNLLAANNAANTFTVVTTGPGSAPAPTPAPTVVAQTGDGLYTASYKVPTYNQGNTAFTITVRGSASGVTAAGVGSATGVYNAQVTRNAAVASNAISAGTGRTSTSAGVLTTFTITDRQANGAAIADGASQTIFSVRIVPQTAGAADEINVVGSCPNGGQTCVPRTISYSVPTMGSYRLYILGDNLETIESGIEDFVLQVGPGAVYPPNTLFTPLGSNGNNAVAGQTFSFKAQVRDSTGNILPAGHGATITWNTAPIGVTYTQPTVTLQADGSFTITTTFIASGAPVIAPLVNAQATTGLSVAVATGPVDPARSSWAALPADTPLVAGQRSASFRVSLKDAFGNGINTAQSNPCVVSFTATAAQGQPTDTLQTATDATNGVYGVTYVPKVSDYSAPMTSTISCMGVRLMNPPTNPVRVNPAAVDASQSLVTMAATASAGQPYTITLALKDGLGNPWRNVSQGTTSASLDTSTTKVLVSAAITWMSPAVSISNVEAIVKHDDSQPNKGIFTATYTPRYASPGAYTFRFSAVGAFFVPAGVKSVTVAAGDVYMPNAGFPANGAAGLFFPGGSTIVAGSMSSPLSVQLRDANANPLAVSGLSSQIFVQFYTKASAEGTYCNLENGVNLKDTSRPTNAFNWTVVDTPSKPGSYDITYISTVVGAYWMDVTYGAELIPNSYIVDCVTWPTTCQGANRIKSTACTSIASLTGFSVVPGPVSPPHTLLSDTRDGFAGDFMNITITLRDRFENPILGPITNAGTTSLAIGAAGQCSGLNPQGYPVLTPATATFTIFPPVINAYVLRFQANNTGFYLLPLLVGNTASAAICPRVFVKPALIRQVRVFNSNQTTQALTAGLPARLTLETLDRYGNPAFKGYALKNTATFYVTFTRLLQSAYTKTVAVTVTDLNEASSFAIIDTEFTVDGVMSVSIRLPKDMDDVNSTELIWPNDGVVRTLRVAEAACSTVPNAAGSYRCADRSCRASYADCPVAPPSSCPVFSCPGDPTECVNSLAECTSICSSGSALCDSSSSDPNAAGGLGYCALPNGATSTCPVSSFYKFCPPQFPVPCGGGVCRHSRDDCPTKKVCPPFTTICPDGRSCASSLAACPPVPMPAQACTNPMFPFQCRDSRCVRRFEDCATERTCGPNMVLCPDDTCATSSAMCQETFTCLPGQVKCSNGECRSALEDCPSGVTCAFGHALCPNGACRWSDCSREQVQPCTKGVRCADGTCRLNRLQCPTSITCPTMFPVLCADQSCVDDAVKCRSPRHCTDAAAPFLCPDGSCVLQASSCPTTISCPKAKPTRCHDGSCAEHLSDCDASILPTACPAWRPYRCSDGSCAGAWSHCPTKQLTCGAEFPVLCPDRTCVSSWEMCAVQSLAPCPEKAPVRCGNGACAVARTLCPTQVTCGFGYVRGNDGSCHLDVPAGGNVSALFAFISGSAPSCAPLVQCPQSHQGTTCATSLSECPQDLTCPRSKPIRCSDASCAASPDECLAVQPVLSTFQVCPAGVVVPKTATCPQSTVCPPDAPSKCWDESCRVLPTDCPPVARCTPDSPYLCSSGTCVRSPQNCLGDYSCASPTAKIKCPHFNQCVSNSTQCRSLFTDFKQTDTGCPLFRCRDGFCAPNAFACPALTCPPHTPELCPDGSCTARGQCPILDNGCPVALPARCADGACVANGDICQRAPHINLAACPTNVTSGAPLSRCADGSCPASDLGCGDNTITGCPLGQVLCRDGTCGTATIPAKPPSQLEVKGTCVDGSDTANACPAWRPYRCSDGFCARSSHLCPLIPYSALMLAPVIDGRGLTLSVRCADGSYVAFASECPIIKPCLNEGATSSSLRRCPNGQCRDQCPPAETCSQHFPFIEGLQAGYRCQSGHCAPDQNMCLPEDAVTRRTKDDVGCPKGALHKCKSGQCVSSPGTCTPSEEPLAAGAPPPAVPPPSGCPVGTKVRCWNGACVTDVSGDRCPAMNGCPGDTPFLCADGSCQASATTCALGASCSGVRCPDGRCGATLADCKLRNGCPLDKPRRCADGSCALFGATQSSPLAMPAPGATDSDLYCQPTVMCDASAPVLCFDGSCVADAKYCRPVWPCPLAADTRCAGWGNRGVCVNAADVAPMPMGKCPVGGRCPLHSPVLCLDGACVSTVAQCSDRAVHACPANMMRCFDGSCVSGGPAACAEASWNAFQKEARAGFAMPINMNLDNATCARSTMQSCPDGSCVEFASQCGFVPACPVALPMRCPDGKCINGTALDCAPITPCDSGLPRCEDGLCRKTCLPFAGCPRTAPYACYGRKVACTATREECVGMGGAGRRLLQTADSTDSQETCISCQNALVAASQTVTLARSMDQVIDVAVDSAAVPRTQLYIPAGAFGARFSTLTVVPVAPTTLPCYTLGAGCRNWDGSPFAFSTNVLSTPFKIRVDDEMGTGAGANQGFQGAVQVIASVDNKLYGGFTAASEVARLVVPCELQGATFSLTPDAEIYLPGQSLQYGCRGSLTLTNTSMSLTVDPACDGIQIQGTYVGQNIILQPWRGEASRTCNCFMITSSVLAEPATKPIYAPRNTTGAWARYAVGSQVCFFMARTGQVFKLAVYTPPALAAAVCPFLGRTPNALFWDMTRFDPRDGCAGRGIDGMIDPKDICLASLSESGWDCLIPDHAGRVANPTWSEDSGRPQTRVSGSIGGTGSPVLAFAYVPLPPPEPEKVKECNWLCKYWKIVLGLIIGIGAFIACSAYVIWRLQRYRVKYRQNKKDLQDLKERAREIDETAGGLGIADDEVDMMANPMVIEMRRLDEQLTAVNLQLDTQAEHDSRKIDALSQDRERLHAELQRLKALAAQQQKTTATRLEDVHVSQRHHTAEPTSGYRGPPPGMPPSHHGGGGQGLVPMEMESGSGAGAAHPGAERHGFGQVRRPNKKRDDL